MRLVTWNVNGIRACVTKGLGEFVQGNGADVFCFQETKMQPGQADIGWEGYEAYWNSAEKKGYSGTAVFTKRKPLSVTFGLGIPEHDHEGRVITTRWEDFTLVNVYVPNSQQELTRLSYRMEWEDAFREYIVGLDKENPVLVCGDLNVAHMPIDLKNPDSNHHAAGFTDEERGKLTELLGTGFKDTFRTLYPDLRDAYTWWSYRFRSRDRNAGWRIDYFLASERLMPRVKDVIQHTEIMGSDHCPVEILLKDE